MFAHALCLLVSMCFSWLLGTAHGRTGERHRLTSPVVIGSGERRLGDYAHQLQIDLGKSRLHVDPANAPRMRKVLIRR